MTKNTINFYRTVDEYGCFSNFSRHELELHGKTWRTSEHFFQAMKFMPGHPEIAEKVRLCKTPGDAARMGRDRSLPLRKDWESVKNNVMREAIRAKFSQHDDIRQVLVSTGDAKLVEHTDRDSYWGDGGDGSGQNWLGRLLMDLREEFRKEANSD